MLDAELGWDVQLGAGTHGDGLAAVPECSAMTQVSLPAAWCPVHCLGMTVSAFQRCIANSQGYSWHSIPWENVLIQMFLSQYVGAGVNAEKYKTCDTL